MHIAGIRYTKGLGGAAVYLRARDATAQYWDWTTLAWSATEEAACKQALAERQDSDAAESRYMASVALPPGVQSILEYVLASTAEVLGEEQTVPQAVIEVAGTVPSAPEARGWGAFPAPPGAAGRAGGALGRSWGPSWRV
jgi:hypothetical protein